MEKETKKPLGDDINEALDDVKEYINLRIRLIQLNVTEKVAQALANLIATTAALIFFILFFLFGSLALGYWLGELLDSAALGFALVAGFYLLIALLLQWSGKKSIRTKLTDTFIREFSNDQTDDDEA